ncbi:ATP-dependent DNA helicase PIF1 [Purpureocillium lavendulum]|uniref:ATP-dependent DNA helicase PIF1 n=1 Tax=Purpureocillium lavendulum TaxID=1247861 RepID=A0AB34FDC6_9HYPO|nr:ATP-dependent DNA helicase PIF1 [Purpureocillium lavendulum]
MASSMVAPDLVAISRDLNISSKLEGALTLSIFVAAYALGPLFWGPLSELYGRVVILQTSNLAFAVFNLACGFAPSEGNLVAFRFLSGMAGSAPLAVGAGVLGDLFEPEERGRASSVYTLMPLLGPAVGPILGGWVEEKSSWHWVFFSTTIACGLIQVFGLLVLRETYAPVVLRRKASRLRRETGNLDLRTGDDDQGHSIVQKLRIALTRPFRLLVTQPILQLLSFYMLYLYGLVYLVLSTFAALWSNKYNESTGIQGLNYISLGLGFFLGAQACAPIQDRVYAAMKRRYVPDGEAGQPEFRVPMMVPGALLVPVGLLIYSWTAEARVHWIAPNIGATIYGAGTIISFLCLQTYVVDAYGQYAASAIAAITVLRSLAGFGFPLFAPIMYDRLGYGKGGTILAGCAVVIGWPSPVILWLYGRRLRAGSKVTVR